MSVNLAGNILVTGTSRGIGLELVKQLAEKTGKEAHIYAGCRDPEGKRAKDLRDLATQFPGKITIIKLGLSFIHCGVGSSILPFWLVAFFSPTMTLMKATSHKGADMSDEDSISAAFQIVSRLIEPAGLNLLINNAAINKPDAPAAMLATRKQDMMEMYETNVFLPLLQRAAKTKDEGDQMSCRRSAVINISTLLSSMERCPETFQFAQMYPYRTSKAALNMLTRCQAEDFRIHNIMVTAIHPGWVRTEMGGEQAPLTTQESVAGMLSVISTLSNKDTGMLLDGESNAIPW